MDIRFGLLVLLFIVLFLIGVTSPSKSLFWIKGRTTRGMNFLFCLVSMLAVTTILPSSELAESEGEDEFGVAVKETKDFDLENIENASSMDIVDNIHGVNPNLNIQEFETQDFYSGNTELTISKN